MPAISNDWAPELKPEYKKEYYKELFNFVGHEYATREIFPPADDIFNAFHLTPLSNRSGSLPQRRAGAWSELQRKAGCRHPAFSC